MYKYFIKFIDWFEKFFKRFKVIGYFIVIIFVILYFIENGFERKRAIEIAEKLTGLNIERDLLFDQKESFRIRADSLSEENYRIKEERDSVISLQEQEALRSSKYRRERDEAWRELAEFTPTTRYVFLDEVAYPYIGEKIYPFNARQMEGMHETYIENKHNKNILASTQAELDFCKEAAILTGESEMVADTMYAMAGEELAIDEKIMAIDEEVVDIAMKQWKKERRKNIWGKVKTWVYTAAGFAGGFILGGK